MRETFSAEDFKAIAKPETTATAGGQSHRIDLSERLKLKPAYNNPASEKTEPTTETNQEQPEETTGTEKPEAEPSATFTDDKGEPETEEEKFERFANTVENSLNEEDAIDIAKMIVNFGNIGRLIFFPGLYEGFAYPGQERNDIRGVISKTIENEKKITGRTATFEETTEGLNSYELRLYKKWPKFREAIDKIDFTDDEKNTLAKYLAREIGDMTVGVWVKKHMWFFYWMYLETSKASPIMGARATDWFSKKFGLA